MDLSVYKALFRTSPYPYLVFDTDLVIMGASGSYLRSVKRTEEEIVGRYLFEAFPPNPDDPDSTNDSEVKASIARAVAKGEPDTTPFLRYAVPVETGAGVVFEHRYWSTVHTPVMDENGKPLFVFQNAIDVTSLYRFDRDTNVATLKQAPFAHSKSDFNQAQMHEAVSRILNNEREHLRSLFDQAPGFVAVLMGPNHVFELANSAYYQLVGHRDIIGKAVWDALPEVAGQGFEEFLNKVYHTGVPWTTRGMPIAVQRVPNGPVSQRYVDLVYAPYRDADGNTIGIFAQGYDVTESVEAQLAKREADERLRDGLEAAKMVVWDWDFATGKLDYSDNVMDVMGLRPETMAAVSVHIHPDDRKATQEAHQSALEGAGTYQIIIRFIRPDSGKQIWVSSRGRVRYNALGSPVGIRGVTVDVTERYQAEMELREASQRKDEFLAMLAHELRNPLAPISTAAELLRYVSHVDPKVERVSDVISRQVKHMTSLVDDLLDASRVTRGLVELDKQVVSLMTIVDSAIEQSLPLIESKKHSLLIQTDGTTPQMLGDRTRLVQILANLVNNSAKYTPDCGDIVVRVSTQGAFACVEVRDNGIGITEQLLPHVFDLFTQAARTPDRSQGGLGIGLALVKTMVSLHGGRIYARSDGPGTGSVFTVELPLA